MIDLKKRKKKTEIEIDPSLSAAEQRRGVAIALTKSPKFFMEQMDALQMAQIAAIIMDDNVQTLANGMFKLKVSKSIQQLYKNAYKATTRLLDALLKEYEDMEVITGKMKGRSYESLTDMAYSFSELIKIYYCYMSSPEDEWRQTEVLKTINKVLGDDPEGHRLQQITDYLNSRKPQDGQS